MLLGKPVAVSARVTTEGGRTAESADSPSTAWRELLAAESGAACELRLSGARLFGLENPTVQRLVQALPHAGRCMRFEAWAGPRPDFKPLVSFILLCCFILCAGLHALIVLPGCRWRLCELSCSTAGVT